MFALAQRKFARVLVYSSFVTAPVAWELHKSLAVPKALFEPVLLRHTELELRMLRLMRRTELLVLRMLRLAQRTERLLLRMPLASGPPLQRILDVK